MPVKRDIVASGFVNDFFTSGLVKQALKPRNPQPADTKKWACAHSIVRPVTSEIKVYARDTAKAR